MTEPILTIEIERTDDGQYQLSVMARRKPSEPMDIDDTRYHDNMEAALRKAHVELELFALANQWK